MKFGFGNGVKCPGADDLVGLGPQREGIYFLVEIRCLAAIVPAICGVSEDVAQVSITSGSGLKVLLPQFGHGDSGWSSSGSTGS